MVLTLNRDHSSKTKVLITSILFMGLSHILYLKQYVKGVFFMLMEIAVILLSPKIITAIKNLISLGDPHPELPIKQRDNSIFMMIDGIMILAVVFLFILMYVVSVKSALSEYKNYCIIGYFSSNTKVLSGFGNKSFPIVGLLPLVLLVLFFVVVPLVFSAAVAFTNYSAPNHLSPNNTVDWVGGDNFAALFGGDATWSGAFGRVAVWTLVWAVLATFTCYAGGLIMAVLLHEYKFHINPIFRSIFHSSIRNTNCCYYASMAKPLNGSFGIVNRILLSLDLCSKEQ